MSELISAQELERAAIFKQLTAEDVKQATKDIQLVKLKSGDELFHQGDAGDSIFFVVSGQLDVTLDVPGGGTCVVGRVGPNSVVGEMSLLLEQPRTASVVAAGDAELWKVSRDNFLESISWNERWANQFLFFMAQLLARRLAGMNDEIVDMVAQQQREEASVQWRQIEALRKHLYSVLEAQDFRGLDENDTAA